MKLAKKIAYILGIIVILAAIAVAVYYFVLLDRYNELSAADIEAKGGQQVVNDLIKKYEDSSQQLDDAIQIYNDSGQDESKKPDVKFFVNKARYADYIKKYDVAINTLEDVFNYYDTSDIALINMAHVYEDMDEYQKAIDTYLRFYDMFGVQIQQFHVDIMKDYMALDDKANVIKYYKEYREAGFDNEEIKQYVTTP